MESGKIVLTVEPDSGAPVYSHLDPIIDVLLGAGN